MLLTILKKRQRHASARLCWKERHPKVSSMSETLALGSKLHLVQRAARRWTFLIWIILFLMMGIPNGCSIFQLRPDQGSIGSLSNTWHLFSYVSLYKTEGFVGSSCDPVYVWAPGQVAGDVHPKIPNTGNSLQDHIMQHISGTYWFPGSCHLHLLALPVELPHRQSV